MAEQTPTPQKKWHEIFLPQLGGLMTALSVALVGTSGAYVLNKKQNADTRAKVYAELTSQREQADTVMRKDMFAQIIASVLEKDETPDRTVLNMELLAYNFHESLNLKPLFSYVRRHLDQPPPAKQEYVDRLEKVAQDVIQKQLLVLNDAGKSYDCTIDLKTRQAVPESQSLKLGGSERVFTIAVREVDLKTHELKVLLRIMTLSGQETEDVSFTVGPFDFPMIDNTRLSGDQRFAVVLQSFREGETPSARLTLVYFPGSRASLREKTFSEDILRNLENPQRD